MTSSVMTKWNLVIDIEKCKLVRIDEDDRQNQIKKGDILFTTSSETRLEVGFTSVVLEEPNEVYLNSFCFGFRLNSFDALRPEFARCALKYQASGSVSHHLLF